MPDWSKWLVVGCFQFFVAGGMFWAIRSMLQMAIKDFKDDLQTAVNSFNASCTTKSGFVAGQINEIKSDNAIMWDAINTHGHSGLKGDDGKVTRG